MNFEFTEEHKLIQEMARDFAEQELKPGVIDRDEKQYFPRELLNRMGELGFMGMMIDPKYNGGGMDTVSYVIALSEIAKWDASAAVILSVNNSLVSWGLENYGSDFQKEKYLTRLTTGEGIGAFCL
ncbi:MAG: acyl-CoA dehydrogenase family protein, partial [Bacteroidetes bacterium]|nr:acyl-CoA dehydrogenase family protein [Bacteroidota bacterium]